MGSGDGPVDGDGGVDGAGGAGAVALRAPKRARDDQEDGVSALPDELVLRCPRVAAAATEIAETITRTKRGARIGRELRAMFDADVCAREVPGTGNAYVQLGRCHPVQLAPLLAILARHPAVRAHLRADTARLVLSPGAPYGELPQKKATFERAIAVACRAPAATLRTTPVAYLETDFDQILAPAAAAMSLTDLLNYRGALEDAWLIVDDGVGLLRRVKPNPLYRRPTRTRTRRRRDAACGASAPPGAPAAGRPRAAPAPPARGGRASR